MHAKAHKGTSLAVHETDSDVSSGAERAKGSETNRQRNSAALRLVRDWLSDESGYDEETWPQLKRAMEDNRHSSSRKLFNA